MQEIHRKYLGNSKAQWNLRGLVNDDASFEVEATLPTGNFLSTSPGFPWPLAPTAGLTRAPATTEGLTMAPALNAGFTWPAAPTAGPNWAQALNAGYTWPAAPTAGLTMAPVWYVLNLPCLLNEVMVQWGGTFTESS